MDELQTLVNSRSNELTYSELQEFFPGAGREYLIDYLSDLQQNIDQIARYVDENISPQFGTGSPEGVVTANANKTYYDLSGTPELWVNPTQGSDIGWVQVV